VGDEDADADVGEQDALDPAEDDDGDPVDGPARGAPPRT
jgi:hypothetical protein